MMMTVTADGLSVHRGTNSVIRAKTERTLRELDGASLVELTSDRIGLLAPVPWRSLSLFEEQARRVLAFLSVTTAVALTLLLFFLLSLGGASILNTRADQHAIEERSKAKSLQLLRTVQELRASPMREQLAQFSDVNDGLLALNGWLDVYQIKDNKTLWRASVPSNVTSERINELGAQMLDSTPECVVICNGRDALGLGRK